MNHKTYVLPAENGFNAAVIGASGNTGLLFNTQLAGDITVAYTYTRDVASDVTDLVFTFIGELNSDGTTAYGELASNGGAVASGVMTETMATHVVDRPVTATESKFFNVTTPMPFTKVKVTRTGTTNLDTLTLHIFRNVGE